MQETMLQKTNFSQMDVKALVQNLFPNKEHNILEKEEERNVRKVLSLCAVILMYMCLWITYASAEIAFVFDEAWDEEHETYTSENYGLQVMLSGLEDNTVYRAMLMGETLHGESFSIPAIVYPIGNGNAQINIWDLVTEPGVYENLVLAVAGNDELLSQTFTFEQKPGNEDFAPIYGSILDGDLWVSGEFFCFQEEERINAYYDGEFSTTSPAQIIAPMQDAVYSGYPGITDLFAWIAFNENVSVDIQLTCIESDETVAYWNGFDGDPEFLNGLSLTLPEDWTPGQYMLRLLVDQEEIQTVTFTIALEEDPSPLFAAVHPGEYIVYTLEPTQISGEDVVLWAEADEEAVNWEDANWEETNRDIDLGLGFDFTSFSGTWNPDQTVLTADSGSFSFSVHGLEPGIPYYAALLGVDVWGETFVDYINLDIYGDGQYASGYCSPSSLPGTYENLTLAVMGGEESIAHTFTYCVPVEDSEQDFYCIGPVFGMGFDDYLTYHYDGDNFLYNADEEPKQSGIRLPQEGTVVYGHSACGVLEVGIEGYREAETVKMVLTDAVIGTEYAQYEQPSEYCDGVIRLYLTQIPSSGEYTLTLDLDGNTVDSINIMLENAGDLSETFIALMPEQTLSPFGVDISEELRTVCTDYEVIETDQFLDFARYQYDATAQDSIKSFVICMPNVKATEVETDRKDLCHTANWALKNLYLFQQRDIIFYGNQQILNLDENDFVFERDMRSFDFAAGRAIDDDGTVYEWLPVYFSTEDGAIYNDNVYLFVYTVMPGADTAYLDSLNYFNPEFYHEYHTSKMLITDQRMVAALLRQVQGNDCFDISQKNTACYPTLSYDEDVIAASSGEQWFIQNLQDRLRMLGYLEEETSSVTYDQITMEAVKAFEKAVGLEADGIADNEMQNMLFDVSAEKEQLSAWLERH